MAKLILFNKPHGVVSQFSGGDKRATLADYIAIPEVYPAGRLDQDSEGLLLLTDDGIWQDRIANPKHKKPKTYWVQVENIPHAKALRALLEGVTLKDGPARALNARLIETPEVWERIPPIRQRKHIPTQWLEMTIDEGRNRQVRRMTAAVGFPTLRLIRVRVGEWSLGLDSVDPIGPGQWRELTLPTATGGRNKSR